MEENRKLELYIHIPFCEKKCGYCDFLSFPIGASPADEDTKWEYVKTLKEEIAYRAGELSGFTEFDSLSVPSLFIGGGTPSVLSGTDIMYIMDEIYKQFKVERDAEITIECNPGTLNQEKLRHYKQAGINRISLGLQSVHNHELKLLGRIHTWEQFLESYELVRKIGFENVNLDLMSALPGQNLHDWEACLKKAAGLKPEHISAYSLIIEEGTCFYDRYGEDERRREAGNEPQTLPGEETERAMYELTQEYLAGRGYRQYEISNYAKPGKECRHNVGYWTRENYLGLGLGSASLLENRRFCNSSRPEEYFGGAFEKQELTLLSRQEQMEEYMFLGLRLRSGISREKFRESFGVEIQGVYGREIQRLCAEKLLEQKEGNIFLTKDGIFVSNYVMAQFLKKI